MKDITQFLEPLPDFSQRSAPFQIEAFAWFLHEVRHADYFSTADIRSCFEAAHVSPPANIAASIAKLESKKPARILRSAVGFRLSKDARAELSRLLPVRATAVKTTALLNELVSRVTDPAQKTFLAETLSCFKHHAYRAAVIMAWNLAFSDVLDRIISKHLAAFNTQVGTHNLKKPIIDRVDFEKLKESEVIKIAAASGILGKESVKKLEEKLGKRNTAAHPSNVVVSVATAEEVIADLVENIVLRPTL